MRLTHRYGKSYRAMVAAGAALVVSTMIFVIGVEAQQQRDRATRLDGPTDESQRLALVIGNGAYAEGALKNPVNDLRAMSETLADLGFEIMAVENATMREMLEAISGIPRSTDDRGRGSVLLRRSWDCGGGRKLPHPN